MTVIQKSLSKYGLPWWLMVKNLPVMQEIWVQSLSWEDPLEKGMVTWRLPDGLRSVASQIVGPN